MNDDTGRDEAHDDGLDTVGSGHREDGLVGGELLQQQQQSRPVQRVHAHRLDGLVVGRQVQACEEQEGQPRPPGRCESMAT